MPVLAFAILFGWMLLWLGAVLLLYVAFAHKRGQSRARWLTGTAIYVILVLFSTAILGAITVSSSSGGAVGTPYATVITTPR